VRTHVKVAGRWHEFQDFMIRSRATIEDVEFRGAPVEPAPEALEAIRGADAIIIGPSNPVISIDPILAVLREEVLDSEAPVVAVSPLVHGQVLKGPTAEFLAWAGRSLDSNGIAAHYAGLIDGLVADQRADHMPTLETDVELNDPHARRRVAREVLEFATALA
jgi:LPPG:FO 2-phospho-L-lactate transferase